MENTERPISVLQGYINTAAIPVHNKTILLTGGTGSFGQAFVKEVLPYQPTSIRIYSRSELPQVEMQRKFQDERLRFFIGDIRDKERLIRASDGCDLIVHAAALKHVPICEYNPREAVQTNIMGAMNLIECAIDCGIEKVIAISTDKAVQPVNLYGATKQVMEKLLIQANVYARQKTSFSCVRYGNVVGSSGSIVPLFQEQAKSGRITITDSRMTRFWLTLSQGVNFVLNAINMMRGGEIFIPKIPSMRVINLARAISMIAELDVIGIRPGEKLYEILITPEEARHAQEFEDHFRINPEFAYWTEESYIDKTGKVLPDNFSYRSDMNKSVLEIAAMKEMIERL